MKFKNIENLEEFKLDYNNLTIDEITKKYKLNCKTIWSYARKLSINRPVGSKRINSVDDSYFSKESSNMYYILGLIYTDGNLPINNKNSFIISNTDKKLLEDIKLELKFSGKIIEETHNVYNKKIYKLQVTSEQIRKDLENFGLHPNKTFDLKFPNIPENYIRDFIRGLWDGDGSVSLVKPKNKPSYLLISNFVCANEEFIKDVLKFLPIGKKKIYSRTRKNILYSINLRAFDSIKIKNFLYYDNCLCMKRKRDIFFSYKPRRSETIIHNPNKD